MSKRLQAELLGLKNANVDYCVRITVDELDMFTWKGMIIPKAAPYNAAGIKFVIEFPGVYPFKAPTVKVKTKMYHPNVKEGGEVCLPVLTGGNWTPKTKAISAIEELIYLIDNPNADDPVRMDVAEQFNEDFETFYRTAAEHTSQYGEKLENPEPGVTVSIESTILSSLAGLSVREQAPHVDPLTVNSVVASRC